VIREGQNAGRVIPAHSSWGTGCLTQEKNLVERHFRAARGSESEQVKGSLTWEDLTGEHVVVVLGDPGAGKTTEFEQQAQRIPGAVYLPIRTFLLLPLGEPRLRSETLFLDALDEMRASGNGRHEVLDRIIGRLAASCTSGTSKQAEQKSCLPPQCRRTKPGVGSRAYSR
jgi:hypothetical protein